MQENNNKSCGLKNPKLNALLYGIIKGNPVAVLMIGLCPVLAISTTVYNAIGMSIAVAFVLTGSNLMVSLVRKLTPNQIRIPVFIIIISTFVTIVDYLIKANFPDLYKQLGIFIPLIVVNCIIIGRVEAFAYRNSVLLSILDAIGSSIGFLIVLFLIGAFREILGQGTFLNKVIFNNPCIMMILPPGGFITIGIIMGVLSYYNLRKKKDADK
ncbi:MAG: electron transport complex subunit RsxE [Endomicrobiia bacterium]